MQEREAAPGVAVTAGPIGPTPTDNIPQARMHAVGPRPEPEAYVVTDHVGVIVEANPTAAALLGTLSSCLEHRTLLGYSVPHLRGELARVLVQVAITNQPMSWTVQLQTLQNGPRDIQVHVMPVHSRTGHLTALRWLLAAPDAPDARLPCVQPLCAEVRETYD